MEDEALERTNRVNLLYDFYGSLLTDKQQVILSLYYQDNFSLGEIAAELAVSRQAVYEHVKRAEQALEEYEFRLRLADKHNERLQQVMQLQRLLEARGLREDAELQTVITKLQYMDDRNDER